MPKLLRPSLAVLALTFGACEAKAPPPTPAEAARAALADLDAANVRLNIEFTGVSAILDPVYATGARAQGAVSFMSALIADDADVELVAWLVLMEAAQTEAEALRDTLDQMNDLNDEKHNKRDALTEMVGLNDTLRDALQAALVDAEDTDSAGPAGTAPATLSLSTNLLLGQAQGSLLQAKGDVTATLDCPGSHYLDGQLDLIDLATGDVVTSASTWPMQVSASFDDWTTLRATGRLLGGDAPVDTLVACTLQIDHAGLPSPDKVDWTDARLNAFSGAATGATRALRLARAEVAKLYADQTLSPDEVVAFSAVLSGYETRLIAMSRAATAKDLTVTDLTWLDGQADLQDQITLRLQTVLDRRQKFLNTLSNVMKDVGTTQNALTTNLK
jgi:hypothetical protein